MYETYYDKVQPNLGEQNIQIHYMDTDSFVLSIKINDIVKDLQNLNILLDSSNLDKNQKLFSKKRKSMRKIQNRNS